MKIFKNSENNRISVKLAKVLGYFSSKSFRISTSLWIVIATAILPHAKAVLAHLSPLCIIATSYEDNVNFLDYWNVGLFSQEMFAIFHQLIIIFVSYYCIIYAQNSSNKCFVLICCAFDICYHFNALVNLFIFHKQRYVV